MAKEKTLKKTTIVLLRDALKQAGCYDPREVMYRIEENLTLDEAKTLNGFLGWVHENQTERGFGLNTINDRFAEYLAQSV